MKREEAVQHSYLGNLYTEIGAFEKPRGISWRHTDWRKPSI